MGDALIYSLGGARRERFKTVAHQVRRSDGEGVFQHSVGVLSAEAGEERFPRRK